MPIVLDRMRYALPRAGADDVEIFAVGDIHGRSDLLAALLDEAAREPRRAARRVVVLLGDLVDRGPDSLGAIDLAIDAAERAGGDETVALMGNHEAMMRLALDAATPHDDAIDALQTWIVNGGDHTLAEFVRFSATPADLDDLLSDARESLPARVADWLASLRSHWRSGGLLFVHAGVNPERRARVLPRRAVERAAGDAGRRPPLGLGAPAFPFRGAGAAGIRRLFRRPRPHAQRPEARPVARRPDPPLPPQPRLRLGHDRRRRDGDLARRERRGRDGARAVRLGDGQVSGVGRIAKPIASP